MENESAAHREEISSGILAYVIGAHNSNNVACTEGGKFTDTSTKEMPTKMLAHKRVACDCGSNGMEPRLLYCLSGYIRLVQANQPVRL